MQQSTTNTRLLRSRPPLSTTTLHSMSASVELTILAPTASVLGSRRLPTNVTLADLKHRLEMIVGIPPSQQLLSVFSTHPSTPGAKALQLPQGLDTTLEQLGATDGWGILVGDTNPSPLISEDDVEKYEMDDETYAARTDSVRAFKERNRLGRFAETQPASQAEPEPEPEPEPTHLKVGSRCQVALTNENTRRGSIRFVGQTEFAKGTWVGVEYDEPVGKNDGSVEGKKYFSCRPKHGGFIRPDKVTAGNFPEEDIDLDLDDDEEM